MDVEAQAPEAEGLQRTQDATRVGLGGLDEQIEITRQSRPTVSGEGVRSYDYEPDAVRDEQPQQFFPVAVQGCH
jgi:hypothetical protein